MAAKTPPIRILYGALVRGHQRNDRKLYFAIKTPEGREQFFRILIHWDNSYAYQSHAHLERWDGQRWHNAVSLLAEDVKGLEQAEAALLKLAPQFIG